MNRHRFRICHGVAAMTALMASMLPSISAEAITVRLEGLQGAAATNVINYLKPLTVADDADPEAYRRQINSSVSKALKAHGYYTPEVTITALSRSQVKLKITPGDPVILRGLNIEVLGEAEQDDSFKHAVEHSALVADQGQPLSHYDYETLKTALSTLAAQRGYFDAHYSLSRIEVRPWEQRADILLVLQSGKRYTYGDIRYRGVQIEQAKLDALRPFEPGDYYLADDLSQYNQRLSEVGWFRSIAIKPELQSPVSAETDVIELSDAQHEKKATLEADALDHLSTRGQANIDVTVTPADRHRFETSIGFSTDEGPRTKLSWDRPWVNSRGDRWNNSLYLSAKKQIFSGLYTVPLAQPLRDRYEFEYGIKRIDDNDTNSLREYMTPARVWKFANGWEQRLFTTFAYERFTQADDHDTVFMTIPGIAWSRTAVDNPRFPMQGNRQTLRFEGAYRGALSDITFLRSEASSQWITHLGENNRFFGRLVGGTTASDDFHRLPPSLRFFAGGDNSLRGYSYNDIAPRTAAGKLIGGQHMLVGTLEYQRRIAGNWWGAAFYDAGSVWENSPRHELKRAAGLGIRWQSIVGPIRVDIAHPIDSKEDSWRLHFAIGPEF